MTNTTPSPQRLHHASFLPLAALCCPQVPIITGFLGRGMATGAITTLGRGGSDLTATVLGAAMELDEVQVRRGCGYGLLQAKPVCGAQRAVHYLAARRRGAEAVNAWQRQRGNAVQRSPA